MLSRFPHLKLDDGRRFYFGQSLAEAEEVFGVPAKQHSPEIARHVPRQRIIETSELVLTFDADRLMRMEFLQEFSHRIPLAPYSKDWQNIDSFEFPKTVSEMTRKDVDESLAIWEARAQKLGARKIEPGDLAVDEFYTYSMEEEYWNVIGINMGESRRAGGGGLWADGWIINFTSAHDAELYQMRPGFFRSVSAFCDEFNTAARR